jgi:hypothetical protein
VPDVTQIIFFRQHKSKIFYSVTALTALEVEKTYQIRSGFCATKEKRDARTRLRSQRAVVDSPRLRACEIQIPQV